MPVHLVFHHVSCLLMCVVLDAVAVITFVPLFGYSVIWSQMCDTQHDLLNMIWMDRIHMRHLQPCKIDTEMHLFWREFDILYSECIVLQVFCKVLLKLYFRTVCFCGKRFVEKRQFVREMMYNVCVFVRANERLLRCLYPQAAM